MNSLDLSRYLMALLLAVVLTACSSGGGDDTPTANCNGSGSLALSGTITFEDVPVTGSGSARLDYSNIQQKPVRLAQMRVECADGSTVFAESVTDTAGEYSVDVPQGVNARLVVRAASTNTEGPTWDIEVVDNTNNGAVWTLEGESFDTGESDLSVDLVATSGWNGSSYTGERIGGAFSIYDTVYEAMQLVISAEPDAEFDQLTLNWSPNNTSSCDGDRPEGCIGTSFYSAGAIYILGKEDEDTDEYDDSVVAHEWGHYYEDNFSRSDSIGGSHSGGDALDIRVAFGEGWGNAVSGMIIDDTFYRDTGGSNQGSGFAIGLETETTVNEGWWNEISVQLILFDLFDDNTSDGADTFSLGFAPIHTVLAGSQRTTPAFTSIFSFIKYVIDETSADQASVDALLLENNISSVTDIWGSGRTVNFDDAPDDEQADATNPVYLNLNDAVNNGTVTPVCVSDFYGEYNKLGNRRFGWFEVTISGTYEFTLDGSTSADPDALPGSDPDFYIYSSGSEVDRATDDSSGTGIEVENINLQSGIVYTIDLHEWLNVDRENGGGEVCLELTVTGP